MPSRLDAADRKLLIAAAAFVFLLSALTLRAPASGGSQSKIPSTYSSGPGGALAAYLLLENLHYSVRRWEEAPGALAALSRPAMLIIASPSQMPTSSERASLLKFLHHGSRILFCGDSLPAFFPGVPVLSTSAGQEWARFSPRLPSLFTRGARTITMDPASSWKEPGPRQLALYGDEKAPVVAVWKIDRGELLWWAAPTPLSNSGIAQTDNLNLFLNVVSAASPSTSLPIYWDEYFHGARGSLWTYVAATPVKWALVQFILIIAALLFTFSRRSGPIAPLRAVSRLSPLEFVDTLGGLYQRAGATSVATRVAYRHLRLSLARRLALPFGVSDSSLARTAADRLGWNSAHLTAILERAAAAETLNLPPRDALDLVRQLGTYTSRLETKRANPENH